MPAKRISR